MTETQAREEAHRISGTSQIVIKQVPARLWRTNAWGRRFEVNDVRYTARYEEPGIVIQAGGDTEADARGLLASLLAANLAAGLL